MKKVLNHSLTILFIISLFFLIITFSIGLPIYFRPFYYLQIKTLNMEELTGYSYETIKETNEKLIEDNKKDIEKWEENISKLEDKIIEIDAELASLTAE